MTVRPEFALVDEALWQAVRAQDQARTGRGKGAKPTHFLSTLARCTCGGPLHVTRMRWGTGATAVDVPAYACGWAHRRGKAVCANKLRRPVEELDACVLGWVRDELLAPTAVDAILRDLRAALQAPAPVADEVRAQKVAALGRVEAEVARLTRAIATTDDAPEALVRALADAEKRLRALRAEVARHAPHAPTQAEDWPSIEAAVRLRLDALRATFDRQREGARETLRAILRGPIVCRPVVVEGLRGRRYHLTADAALPGFDLMPGVDSVPPITPVASLEGYRGCDRLLVNSPPPKNAKLSRIAGIPRVA